MSFEAYSIIQVLCSQMNYSKLAYLYRIFDAYVNAYEHFCFGQLWPIILVEFKICWKSENSWLESVYWRASYSFWFLIPNFIFEKILKEIRLRIKLNWLTVLRFSYECRYSYSVFSSKVHVDVWYCFPVIQLELIIYLLD